MLESYYDKENFFALSMKHQQRKKRIKRYAYNDGDAIEKFKKGIMPRQKQAEHVFSTTTKTQGLIKSLEDLSLVGNENPRGRKTKRTSRWDSTESTKCDRQGSETNKSDRSTPSESSPNIDSYLFEIFYSDDKTPDLDNTKWKTSSPRRSNPPYTKRPSSSSSHNKMNSPYPDRNKSRKMKSIDTSDALKHSTTIPSNDIRSYFQKMDYTTTPATTSSNIKQQPVTSPTKQIPMEIVHSSTTISTVNNNIEMTNADSKEYITTSSSKAVYPMEISYTIADAVKINPFKAAIKKVGDGEKNSYRQTIKGVTKNEKATKVRNPPPVTKITDSSANRERSSEYIWIKDRRKLPITDSQEKTAIKSCKIENSDQDKLVLAALMASSGKNMAINDTASHDMNQINRENASEPVRKILKPTFRRLRRCNSLIEMSTTSKTFFSTPVCAKKKKSSLLRTAATEPRNKRKIHLKDLFDSEEDDEERKVGKYSSKRYRNSPSSAQFENLPKIPLFKPINPVRCYGDAELGVAPLGESRELLSLEPSLTEEDDVTFCGKCDVRFQQYRYRCPRCWCIPVKEFDASIPACTHCDYFDTPNRKKRNTFRRHATCLY